MSVITALTELYFYNRSSYYRGIAEYYIKETGALNDLWSY